MNRRVPTLVVLLLVVMASVRVAIAWKELPRRFASHFGTSGMPDAWMARGAFFGLYAGIFGLILVLFLGLPWLIRRLPPRVLNLPNKEYWTAPERLPLVHEKLAGAFAWFAVAMACLGISTLELVLRANIARSGLQNRPMWLVLAGFFAFTAVWTVLLLWSFRRPKA